MAFLKDIQDKIVLGRWRFLNLKTLVSQNTSQLAIDENGNLGTVPSNSGEVTDLEGRVGNVESKLENITPTVETAVQPSDLDGYATVEALNTGLNSKVDLPQLQAELNTKVDVVEGMQLSQENFTTEEKAKLAGLEDVHYKGWFTSLASLEAAHPAPEEGSHALVDDASGASVYIWKTDVEPPLWDARVGEGTEMTVAQVKTYYESNPDTNAFTDALKNKLEAFTANFTSALKTAYDNAASWISTNGANVLNHLSNTNNPHNVTAAQLGIVGLENVGKAWIPNYASMETTNRITSSGGSWTSDRRGFVYVLSRGYNSSIYNTVVVTINGKEVGKVWVEATSGSGSARSGSYSNIYPVKPGDVITVTGNLETKCLFIPGVWA